MQETKDLILRKAVLEDWKAMYRNIWSQPESAKYMVWDVTESEEAAVSRMERTIAFQAKHDYHWTVVEKDSMESGGESAAGAACTVAILVCFVADRREIIRTVKVCRQGVVEILHTFRCGIFLLFFQGKCRRASH